MGVESYIALVLAQSSGFPFFIHDDDLVVPYYNLSGARVMEVSGALRRIGQTVEPAVERDGLSKRYGKAAAYTSRQVMP